MKTLRTLGFLATGCWLYLVAVTTTAFGQYTITPIQSPAGVPVDVRALNSGGAVAGFFYTLDGLEQHGFLYQSGTATDIPTLGGWIALAGAVNDNGQVAGRSETADGGEHVFLFDNGNLQDLGTPGRSISDLIAINNAGDIAGEFENAMGNRHVFRYRGGQMLDIGTLGGPKSFFWGMNNNGDIAGDSLTSDMATHAFLYRNGSMVDLGTLPGGLQSFGNGLNDAGEVVGQAETESGARHAFVFRNNAMVDLGTLVGHWGSTANAINDAGDVMGDSWTADFAEIRAFVVRNGQMIDLGTLGGDFSQGYDINNRGQVVGYSYDQTGQAPFLWQNGTMVNLNTLLPPDSGWQLFTAEYINDAGQIVGFGLFEGAGAWYLLSGTATNSANQAPTANAGADQTVECSSAVQLTGSGSDPDGDSLTYDWRNGATPLGNTATLSVNLPLGSHILTLRVSDPAGLNHEDTVVVTVQDKTAPAVVCPGAQTVHVGADCSAVVPDFTGAVVANDTCGSSSTLVKSQTPVSGTLVGLGTHTVTVTVTDASGNSASCPVTLHVVDVTPPTGNCSDPVTAEAGAEGTAAVPDFMATLAVTDDCTPASALVKTQSPAVGTLLGLGSHVVTLTVADAAGNQSTCTTVFHVVDRTAPVVRPPAPVTVGVEANGMGTVPDLVRMCSVSDNCDSDVTLVQNPGAGTQLPVGEHTVTFTATDDSGNSASATTTVTVKDTTAPVISSVSVTPNSMRENGRMISVSVTVNATDNSGTVTSRIVSITSSQPVTSKGDKTSPDWAIVDDRSARVRSEVSGKTRTRVYTITVQSSDAAGNSATATATVTVRNRSDD